MSTPLETNTATMQAILEAVNNLPEAGSGSGGGVEYEIITIPAGATSATYTLPRVTNAFGSALPYTEDYFYGIIGVCDTMCMICYGDENVTSFDTYEVRYNAGTLQLTESQAAFDITLVLINDPSKDALWTCTPT